MSLAWDNHCIRRLVDSCWWLPIAGFNQIIGREKVLERESTYNNTNNGGVEAVELVDNAAIPNEMTAAVDGAAPNPKLHEVDVPAGEVVDINKPIDLSKVPSWREQLTFRALLLGSALGGVFCIM